MIILYIYIVKIAYLSYYIQYNVIIMIIIITIIRKIIIIIVLLFVFFIFSFAIFDFICLSQRRMPTNLFMIQRFDCERFDLSFWSLR